jgi:hypothetical protein
LQFPPKFTQIVIFGLKMDHHMATLLRIEKKTLPSKISLPRFNLGQKYFLGGVRSYMSAKLPFSFQVE